MYLNNSLKKFVTIVILILGMGIYQVSNAQFIIDVADPHQNNLDIIYGKYKEAVGTPFLFEAFNGGTVYLNSGKKITEIQIKYDVYRDQILVKQKDITFVLDNKFIEGFSFNDNITGKPYEFKKHEIDNKTQFLNIIYEGKSVQLLKKFQKIYKEGKTSNGYSNTDSQDKFVSKDSFCLKAKNTTATITNKKQLLRFLGDENKRLEKSLKDYMQKINFSFKNEKLVALLQYYEQL